MSQKLRQTTFKQSWSRGSSALGEGILGWERQMLTLFMGCWLVLVFLLRRRIALLRRKNGHLWLRHFLKRMGNPAYAKTRSLPTSKRHPINPKCRMFIDHYGRSIDPVNRVHNFSVIIWEHWCLEGEGKAVRLHYRIIEALFVIDANQRPKNLLVLSLLHPRLPSNASFHPFQGGSYVPV